MFHKRLALIFALLISFGTASAQSYHVRVSFNTNIRSAPNLEASIVDTVRSGATLLVVGQQEKWLRISQGAREAWMANWVRHTRVEQSGSQVDNCCFVDRQCNSDREWTEGYWAYQNNQCGAPQQSLPQQSISVSAAASADVNNCCFLGWQCNSEQQWTRGFLAYQNNQCDSPIAMEGSEAFVIQVKKALDMLKRWAPEWYTYATSGLDKIREVPESQGSGVWVAERRFDIVPSHAFAGSGSGAVIWLAGIIVHDACHVHRYEAGLQSGGRDGELACLQVQLPATEAIDPRDRFSSYLNTVIANIDNPEYQWWH